MAATGVRIREIQLQLLAAAPTQHHAHPVLWPGWARCCGMLGILGITLKISTIHTVLPRSPSLCPPLPPPPFGQIQHRKAVCFPRFRCYLQQGTSSDPQRPADLLRNDNSAQTVHPADDACCFPNFATPLDKPSGEWYGMDENSFQSPEASNPGRDTKEDKT